MMFDLYFGVLLVLARLSLFERASKPRKQSSKNKKNAPNPDERPVPPALGRVKKESSQSSVKKVKLSLTLSSALRYHASPSTNKVQ